MEAFTAVRKLGACLFAVCISLTALGWTGRPAAAAVPPGFEAEQELAIPTDPVPPPTTENSDTTLVDADVTVNGVQVTPVNSDPGVFGRIRSWFSTHGAATAKGAVVGLVVGGLVAAGAAALGILGAPVLLVVGAGVLGGAIYGAAVGNANFNWFQATTTAALSAVTVATGGLAGVGRATASGASAAGRGLFGGVARGTVGSAARSGIVESALGAPAGTGISAALRTTSNLALSAYDAYETVAVVTDEHASWQEKAIAGLGVCQLARCLAK